MYLLKYLFMCLYPIQNKKHIGSHGQNLFCYLNLCASYFEQGINGFIKPIHKI